MYVAIAQEALNPTQYDAYPEDETNPGEET